MTIIQPNKNNQKINILVSALATTTVIAAVLGVFLYNQLINIRHEISRQEENLQKIEVANAELKNNLYQITDAKNLETSAAQNGLVLEKKPQYLKNESLIASR